MLRSMCHVTKPYSNQKVLWISRPGRRTASNGVARLDQQLAPRGAIQRLAEHRTVGGLDKRPGGIGERAPVRNAKRGATSGLRRTAAS